MSIDISPNDLVSQGYPVLFWRNRYDAFNIGSEVAAHSGKIAITKTILTGSEGFPMLVEYRVATRAHIEAWRALLTSNPFNTTSLASYFVTGYKVMFRLRNPITQQNEIIRDYDIYQTIFDTTDPDYKKGFNRFRGTLNLVITGTV